MLSIGSIRVTVPSYSLLNSMLQQKSTLSDNDKAIHCDSWIFNKFFVTFYTKSFYAGMACLGPNLDRFVWLDLKFRAILGTSCLYHGALDLSWISDKSKIIEKLWVYAPKPQQPTLSPRKPTKQQKKSKAKIKTQPPCFVLCPFFFFFLTPWNITFCTSDMCMCGWWGNDFSLHKAHFHFFCLLPLFFFLSFTSFLPWMTEEESAKGWIFSASMLVSPQPITRPNCYYPSFSRVTNMPFPLSPSQCQCSPKSKPYRRERICSQSHQC